MQKHPIAEIGFSKGAKGMVKMADQTQMDGLNSLLIKDAGANEYFLSLPSFVREKLRDCGKQIKTEKDFYELAETFVREES